MGYRILLILTLWCSTVNAQRLLCNGWRYASGAPTLPTTNLRGAFFGDNGVTHSSNNVSAWTKLSGTGMGDWTQSTSGNRPDWDGSAGITFNGTSDFLQNTYTYTQEANMYFVVEFKSNTASQFFGGQLETVYWGRSTGDVIAMGANALGGGSSFSSSATAPTENQKYLISITVNNASSSIQINNNSATTGSIGYSGNFGTVQYLGATMYEGAPYLYGNVKIYAAVYFGSQTSGEKADTKTYLNYKYSIY